MNTAARRTASLASFVLASLFTLSIMFGIDHLATSDAAAATGTLAAAQADRA
jgi:hypothetical protein